MIREGVGNHSSVVVRKHSTHNGSASFHAEAEHNGRECL